MHEIVNSVLPGELVFDIGANAGDKTDWFLKRGARVVAVEPQPSIAEVLRQRFSGNPNVIVVQKGVSDTVGTLTMYVNAETSVISTFSEKWKTGRFRDSAWREQIQVEITTLDLLIAEYGIPRYTKIDVEGHEKQVMLGLKKRSGVISIEFTSEFFEDLHDIAWYARGLGYKNFNYSLGESVDLALKTWITVDDLTTKLRSVCAADVDAWGDVYFY